jgi:hypothetical protein
MTPEAEDQVEPTMRLPAGSQIVRRAPSRPLACVVSTLTGYLETVSRHFRMIEAASLHVPLVISFGAPFRIALGRPPGADEDQCSFAAGLFGGHWSLTPLVPHIVSRSISPRSAPIAFLVCP